MKVIRAISGAKRGLRARAVKMLRDLRRRAPALAQHMVAGRARAGARARMRKLCHVTAGAVGRGARPGAVGLRVGRADARRDGLGGAVGVLGAYGRRDAVGPVVAGDGVAGEDVARLRRGEGVGGAGGVDEGLVGAVGVGGAGVDWGAVAGAVVVEARDGLARLALRGARRGAGVVGAGVRGGEVVALTRNLDLRAGNGPGKT